MAVRQQSVQFAYGVGDNLIQLAPTPIVSRRDPSTADFAQPGTVWVNTTAQTIWMLASITSNSANWQTSPASGVGIFTSVDVTTGDLTVDLGDVIITTGDLTLAAGSATIAGDLTVDGTLTANFDIDFNSPDEIIISSTFDGAPSIYLHANGGTSEQVKIHSDQGTSASSLLLLSDVGGILISAALFANADAIKLNAPAGGIHGVAALAINLASSKATASAVILNASAGGVDILAGGGAAKDINITNTLGSVNITAGESVSDAIVIEASGAAGEVQIKAGSAGVIIAPDADTATVGIANVIPTSARTVTISGGTVATAIADTLNLGTAGISTNAGASKVVNIGSGTTLLGTNTVNIGSGTAASGTHAVNIGTGTGGGTKTVTIGNADALTTITAKGILNVNASTNANVAFNGGTSTGTFSVGNALAGASTIDSAAGISLDGATASNFTVTGAGADLTLSSVGGSVKIDSTESAAGAIALTANGGVAETITITASQGTGGSAIALVATAGGITLDSSGILELNSSAGVIGIGNDAVAHNINIGTGAAARTITVGNVTGATGIVLNSGTAGVAVNTTGAGDVVITSADTVLIDAAGVLELNSSAGIIGIGNDAVAQNINVGTGAAARTITVGNVTGATGIVLNSGTAGVAVNTTGAGDFTVTSADTIVLGAAGAVTVNSSGGAISIGNNANAQAINVGTAGVRPILIGNASAGTTLELNAPTAVGVNLMGLVRFMAGAGSPNGSVSAPAGSLYLRTDPAGATSRLYINTDSATTWTNITCAA